MAIIAPGEELFELRREFVSLCRESSVIRARDHWVSLDRLWWEADQRGAFGELAARYVELLVGVHSPQNTVIISPDTVSSSFGITPIAFIAGEKLGCPVAVWQELGDLAANKPILIGTHRPRLKCLVLQDVIRYGTTILKMWDSLAGRQWDVIGYACFVLNCSDLSRLDKTRRRYKELSGYELLVEYLVTADTLT